MWLKPINFHDQRCSNGGGTCHIAERQLDYQTHLAERSICEEIHRYRLESCTHRCCSRSGSAGLPCPDLRRESRQQISFAVSGE